jgi:hypothetical protein
LIDKLKNIGAALLKLKDIQYTVENVQVNAFNNENNIPKIELDVSTFSDTIIIALHGDFPISDAFFIYLMGFFLVPLFRKAFFNRIFLRGIVSAGRFFILKRKNGILLVGPAVIDAAQSYGNPNWIGISASPSASLTLEQDNRIDNLNKLVNKVALSAHMKEQTINIGDLLKTITTSFTKYDIPSKSSIERNEWALAWPRYFDNGETFYPQADIEKVLTDNLSYEKYQANSIPKDIFMKFRNTRDFYCSTAKNAFNCTELLSQLNDFSNYRL